MAFQPFKNVGSQILEVFAFDYTTGAPKTGDSANITAYVTIDGGSVTVLADTSATEKSSTNAPGWYQFDLAQGETNGDHLLYTAKSSTGNVTVVGMDTNSRPSAFGLVAGATNGLFIAGTNAATTVTTAFTTTFTGNLTGSVGSVTGLTASNLDATISSRMATYTQPTGFLAATFPATVASTTNITAGTITTATNLTNAPTVGDFTAAMKTSLNAATPAVTVSDKTGFSLTAAYDAAKAAATQASVDSVQSDTDNIQTRLPAALTGAGNMKADTVYVNGTKVNGVGTAGNPWGP